MNYREEIRKYISCPQLGDNHYGKWGALRVEQRLLIKRLLDELDRADNYVKNVYLENQELQKRIDKSEECIKDFLCSEEYIKVDGTAIADNYAEVLKILGGDSND